MERTTGHVGRREVLKKIAAAGVVIPAVGALGLACNDDSARDRREAARLALFARDQAAEAAAARAAAQPVADRSEPQGGATVAISASQAVQLPYLPSPQAAPPVGRTAGQLVEIDLEVRELDAKLSEGAGYTYWTFNGTVPGPMIRVRQGDDVQLTLHNRIGNLAGHNIDLHAVTGPGGGAVVTNVAPGETKTLRFKALHPGVFIYHCATAPIPAHISNGMYGLIIVEPPEGLPPVDREFYICQGEIYTTAPAGTPGMHAIDFERLGDERPSYVVFNGAAGSLTGDRSLRANVGETVRIFFGVGGPNLTSAFHVIGEIFDRASIHGSFADLARDVQTVTVSPGAATMVEFTVQVPGTYIIVDHALSRLDKGAVGLLVVEGAENPEIYTAV